MWLCFNLVLSLRFPLSMPHVHSLETAARRRRRAMDRGVLLGKRKFSEDTYRRLNVIGESLEVHHQCCGRLGRNIHFGCLAASQARCLRLVNHTECASTRCKHGAAALTKHGMMASCPLPRSPAPPCSGALGVDDSSIAARLDRSRDHREAHGRTK